MFQGPKYSQQIYDMKPNNFQLFFSLWRLEYSEAQSQLTTISQNSSVSNNPGILTFCLIFEAKLFNMYNKYTVE